MFAKSLIEEEEVRGQWITKDDRMALLWTSSHEEGNQSCLSFRISQLEYRKAMNHNANNLAILTSRGPHASFYLLQNVGRDKNSARSGEELEEAIKKEVPLTIKSCFIKIARSFKRIRNLARMKHYFLHKFIHEIVINFIYPRILRTYSYDYEI